jgi:hypothetical protein
MAGLAAFILQFILFVVGLQYFFLQVSSLLFLFSLIYFQPSGKAVRVILLLCGLEELPEA